VTFLDTHVALWLANDQITRLSRPARKAIEEAEAISISPIVLLEVQLLVEIGRLTRTADFVTRVLATAGIGVHDGSLAEIASKASSLSWTHDPFDRLIVAHALTEAATLVTKDQSVLDHYPKAVW
jgi:PIN domain nuclease of toxin-antitoxin system